MKHRINIRGVLIPNDYKWFYDWLEMDNTCPKDISKVIDSMAPGDEIEVYVNSPGGVIDVGSEIYTLLRSQENVEIIITGEACSAASIVAMAGHCVMSPTALIMVHCVQSGARGNHTTLEHMAGVLRTADEALCTAYMAKTGMSKEEALSMMEAETWLTAEQALSRGLIDAIMFEEENEPMVMVAGPMFELPSEERMNQVRQLMKDSAPEEDADILLQQKLNLLKLRGEQR